MRLTPEMIVRAYAKGVFPMARSAQDPEVFWFDPRARGVLPLDGFHIARSLKKRRRTGEYRFSVDTAFGAVVQACADRETTWINPAIAQVFDALHSAGLAHSVEVWDRDGALAGGVYGLALGGAFFAESMVSPRRDGSKLALAELVARLRAGGFALLDTQYLTPHLQSLGGIEVSRAQYRAALDAALRLGVDRDRAFGPAQAPDGAVWQL